MSHREDLAVVAVLRRARRDGYAEWLAAMPARVARGVVEQHLVGVKARVKRTGEGSGPRGSRGLVFSCTSKDAGTCWRACAIPVPRAIELGPCA